MVYVAVVVIVVLICLAAVVSLLLWTSCCFVCQEERANKKAKLVSSNHRRHSSDRVTEEARSDPEEPRAGAETSEGPTRPAANHYPELSEAGRLEDSHVVHIDEPDKTTSRLLAEDSGGADAGDRLP